MSPALLEPQPPPNHDNPLYPLYATSYHIHRLSPLCLGEPPEDGSSTISKFLTPSCLAQHAARFRARLTGAFIRDVSIGPSTQDNASASTGGLCAVTWTKLASERVWAGRARTAGRNEDSDTAQLAEHRARGVLVEVVYQKARFKALMLRGAQSAGHKDGDDNSRFLHLPLLLTRMSPALRETLMAYIATTFDARAATLKLSGNVLANALDAYVEDVARLEGTRNSIEVVVRDLLVTLAFPGIADGAGPVTLRSMNVTIARGDVVALWKLGREMGTPTIEPGKQGVQGPPGPLMASLASYLQRHLGLDIAHEAVDIARVACGGFVLGVEGKVKLLAPRTGAILTASEDENGHGDDATHDEDPQRRASERLIDGLITFAKGVLPDEG
jgi:hypothetical protein